MISSPCSAEQAQRIKLCPRKSPPQSFPQSHSKPPDISSGGFLHPLFLLLRIQCTLACFCRRLRQSAIMAMNSEFVGLPLMFETV